jgi:hypothetical protein
VEEDVERGGEGEGKGEKVPDVEAHRRREASAAREGRWSYGAAAAESRAPCALLGIPSTDRETSFLSPLEWTGSAWFGPG